MRHILKDCLSVHRKPSKAAKWRGGFVGHALRESDRPWVAEHPRQTPCHPCFQRERIGYQVSKWFLRMTQIGRESLSLGEGHIQVPDDLWGKSQSISQWLGQASLDNKKGKIKYLLAGPGCHH